MKSMRKIIKIDEELCNGCGLCIPSCAENALQMVDTPKGKKARLVKDINCDGLGACLGHCPTGALVIEERPAEPFVMPVDVAAQSSQPASAVSAPPKIPHACPSARMFQWEGKPEASESNQVYPQSELRQWPVQLNLLSPHAPYFKDADLCIAADCVPFAYAAFHRDFLKGKILAMGCPKLDDPQAYITKLTDIFRLNPPRSIEVVQMEVPCCFGMLFIVKEALEKAGVSIPLKSTVVSIRGEKKAF